MIDAHALLVALTDALEYDHDVASRLRALLHVEPAQVDQAKTFLSVTDYAERLSVSPRHVRTLIARGLPCVGTGRTRRVDVALADAWMRTERTPEARARRDVQRRARAA